MPLYPLLPLVAVAAQNATAALNSRAWKAHASSPAASPAKRPSRRAQSKNPGAGRPPRALLMAMAAMNGRAGRRVLRHEMLQRLGHLMNPVRGRQRQCLCKLLVGGRNPPPGDLLQVLPCLLYTSDAADDL